METRSLGLLLHDASRAVRKRFETRSASFGLTSAQWRMLVHVCKTEGGAPQSHFAELLEIEPISVSRLLDRMEAMGWVVRQSDPNDRRVRRVLPTAKALEVHKYIKTIADDVYAEALAGLTAEQRGALLDALGSIIANLARAECVGQKELS
ncbi:MarR family transcriptional regulator [bacterium]|nr:MarR family transcriptional regulator [bacterium]